MSIHITVIPREIRKILDDNNFVLIRAKKHAIFTHIPSGKTLTLGTSKGNPDTVTKRIAEIKRFLKKI